MWLKLKEEASGWPHPWCNSCWGCGTRHGWLHAECESQQMKSVVGLGTPANRVPASATIPEHPWTDWLSSSIRVGDWRRWCWVAGRWRRWLCNRMDWIWSIYSEYASPTAITPWTCTMPTSTLYASSRAAFGTVAGCATQTALKSTVDWRIAVPMMSINVTR